MDNKVDPLTPRLRQSINNIIEKEKFQNYSIDARILPPDGGSFMAILREVKIKGITENGEKEIDLFIKSVIPGEQLSIYSVKDAYEKEAFGYKQLFKVFDEVQNEADIPPEERFHTPKGYDDSNEDSIIMEDLAKKGFTTCNRLEVIPLEFAQLAIKQLAKFHSLSFVIQENRPYYYDNNVKTLKQPFYYGGAWDPCMTNFSNIAMTCLEPGIKKKVAEYLPTTFAKYHRYTTNSSVKCLVHGDYRANNVMVKFNNGDALEVIPIDYQLMFYGCPIIDFLYFIFGATDKEFRRKHFEDLKQLYHATMTQFLSLFGLDVEQYYPKTEFEGLIKERLDYGLMISLWFIPTNLADAGEIPDLTKVDLEHLTFEMNDVSKKRIRDVVDEFIQWGYL